MEDDDLARRQIATTNAATYRRESQIVIIECVRLITIPGNTASAAVATKAEFLPDGEEIRDHRGSPTRMQRWTRTTRN